MLLVLQKKSFKPCYYCICVIKGCVPVERFSIYPKNDFLYQQNYIQLSHFLLLEPMILSQGRRGWCLKGGHLLSIAHFRLCYDRWIREVKTHFLQQQPQSEVIYSQIPMRKRPVYYSVCCVYSNFKHLLARISEYFTLCCG